MRGSKTYVGTGSKAIAPRLHRSVDQHLAFRGLSVGFFDPITFLGCHAIAPNAFSLILISASPRGLGVHLVLGALPRMVPPSVSREP